MDDDEKSTSHIFSGKIRYLWGALFTLLALLACSISIKSTIKLTKIIASLLHFYCLFETTTLSQSLRAKTTAKQSQRLVVTKAVISPPNGPLKKAGAKSEEDKLLADADSSSKGMFTNVDPAIRTIIPEANGRTVVKMVYVEIYRNISVIDHCNYFIKAVIWSNKWDYVSIIAECVYSTEMTCSCNRPSHFPIICSVGVYHVTTTIASQVQNSVNSCNRFTN